jgi:hypothetical protein
MFIVFALKQLRKRAFGNFVFMPLFVILITTLSRYKMTNGKQGYIECLMHNMQSKNIMIAVLIAFLAPSIMFFMLHLILWSIRRASLLLRR